MAFPQCSVLWFGLLKSRACWYALPPCPGRRDAAPRSRWADVPCVHVLVCRHCSPPCRYADHVLGYWKAQYLVKRFGESASEEDDERVLLPCVRRVCWRRRDRTSAGSSLHVVRATRTLMHKHMCPLPPTVLRSRGCWCFHPGLQSSRPCRSWSRQRGPSSAWGIYRQRARR